VLKENAVDKSMPHVRLDSIVLGLYYLIFVCN